MDIRQLAQFCAVADCGSISAAAQRLRMAQPSLSKSMRLLEEELGTSLLERVPRGVTLTPAGEVALAHARRIGLQLDDLRDAVAAVQQGYSGEVRVGAGPAWLRRLLPAAIVQCQDRYPDMRVAVRAAFDEELVQMLRAGQIDLVVAELPATAPDLSMRALTRDELSVACRRDHPLLARDKLQLADLTEHRWVLPRGGSRAARRIMALFVAHGLTPPRASVEADSFSLILAMITTSDALTYTTRQAAIAAEGEGLRFLAVDGATVHREAGVIRRADDERPLVRLIEDALVDVCATADAN